jgi:hypothetical protein
MIWSRLQVEKKTCFFAATEIKAEKNDKKALLNIMKNGEESRTKHYKTQRRMEKKHKKPVKTKKNGEET